MVIPLGTFWASQVKLFRVKELTGCWRDNGIQILNDAQSL